MSAPFNISEFHPWLATGERGLSSEAIVQRLTGVPLSGGFHSGWDTPHDPADFRRCELLLREILIARIGFPMMRDVNPMWAAFVDAWDELVTLGESEAPDIFTRTPHRGGKAPLMFARIQEVRSAAVTK